MAGEENRDMVICTSCRWSASLLRGSVGFSRCPICIANTVEVIPVGDHESYNLFLKGNTGFEIEFQND